MVEPEDFSGNITVQGSYFYDCHEAIIFHSGASLLVENCQFEKCLSRFVGAAIDVITAREVTITNSSFSGNSASCDALQCTGRGGIVAIEGVDNIWLQNCSFADNRVTGTLLDWSFVYLQSTNAVVSSCAFYNNVIQNLPCGPPLSVLSVRYSLVVWDGYC